MIDSDWQIISSIIAASATAVTAVIAYFAYQLAKRNLSLIADKHNREGVSVVFESIEINRYNMAVKYTLYNRSSIDLLIEDAKANIPYPDHGWNISFYYPNSSKGQDFEWTHKGRNMMQYSNDRYHALTVAPNSEIKILCKLLMHESPHNSLKVAKIQVRLCYDKAESMKYELRIPCVLDTIRIMDAQRTIANAKDN